MSMYTNLYAHVLFYVSESWRVLSVHMLVMQYPYRGLYPLPDTHNPNEQMKKELKNSTRKAE